MSLIEINDSLDIRITNDSELLEAEEILQEIKSGSNAEELHILQIVDQIELLIELYQGDYNQLYELSEP